MGLFEIKKKGQRIHPKFEESRWDLSLGAYRRLSLSPQATILPILQRKAIIYQLIILVSRYVTSHKPQSRAVRIASSPYATSYLAP